MKQLEERKVVALEDIANSLKIISATEDIIKRTLENTGGGLPPTDPDDLP